MGVRYYKKDTTLTVTYRGFCGFFLFHFLKLYRGRCAYHDFVGLFVIAASCESVASSTSENKVGD